MTETPNETPAGDFADEAAEDAPALDEGDVEPDALVGEPVGDGDGAEGGDDGG